MMPLRISGEPYVHKFCTVGRYLLEYNQLSSNITCCQIPSSVRVLFLDSASDIDFCQMSLSQSESTIKHESIIFNIHPIAKQ